jgi:tripartite-type tricarboxylate transporter receptor subunit TctC
MIRTRTPRWWLAIALTSFACTWTSAWAQAPMPSSTPAWPTKPIRLIVPLTPGSATDVMSRVVMDQVSAQLGQPVIVENRPGAGNTIGMAAVAKAEPDGYTVLANSSTHTVTPATRSNLGFEMTDLAPIVPLGNMPVVMVFNPSKGYKKLSDFVAAAKAKPGSGNYASAGAGNSSHLAVSDFARRRLRMMHLFRGRRRRPKSRRARAGFYFARW